MTGVLEAFTQAVGRALNEVGGWRFTRATSNVAAGATTVPVESAFGWPLSGKFIVDGVVHTYTGVALDMKSLTGVSHLEEGVPTAGLKKALKVTTVLVDFSRTYSAIDKMLSSLFVDTAEGESLSIVGRNVGVERPNGLEDDDTFRNVIKALAYLPRGTMFGLELALTAFFGAGNFEVYENFPTSRNTVFIRLADVYLLATSSVGKAYLTVREQCVLNTGTKQTTVTGSPMTIQGVRLAPEESDLDFTAQKPSTPTEVRYDGDAGIAVWTFIGTNEATDVLLAGTLGGHTRFLDTANANTAVYRHRARVTVDSYAYLALVLRPIGLPSLTDGRQFMCSMSDGTRRIAFALFDVDLTYAKVAFVNTTTGAVIGTGFQIPKASFSSVALVKKGTDVVGLEVDGVIVETCALSSFVAATENEFRFGMESTTSTGTDVRLKRASFNARTVTDFWNLHGTGGASLAAATFDTNSAAMVAGDVGRAFRTYDAATKKNNGSFVIATVPTSDNVTLTAPEQQLAILESANPTRVRVAHNARAFKYPDDVGKIIDLSAAQNAPNPGTYVIASILDPVSFTAFSGTSEDWSNVVTVAASPGFVTETEIPWKLLPNFSVESPIAWELSDAGTLAASTLTLRANPAIDLPVGYEVIVEVVYSTVLSAEMLASTEISNDGDDYYPLYLPSDPLGAFRAFVDNLTVAGVIPEVAY